jgi:hypothetical protein
MFLIIYNLSNVNWRRFIQSINNQIQNLNV